MGTAGSASLLVVPGTHRRRRPGIDDGKAVGGDGLVTEHGQWEDDTMPLARPLEDTLELPVVSDPQPPPQPVQQPAPRPVPPEQPPPSPADLQPTEMLQPVAYAPPLRPAPEQPRQARRHHGGRWIAGVLIVLVLVSVAVVGGRLAKDSGRSGGSTGAPLSVQTVRSVDPSGGSGLHQTGSSGATVWRTQRYRSAEFGNLKAGVGLLLDLGRRQRVATVGVTSDVPGTTVELRAGDSASSTRRGNTLARKASASGAVTLHGSDGGRHRYWLIWIPRLGSDGNGYLAQLRRITVSD